MSVAAGVLSLHGNTDVTYLRAIAIVSNSSGGGVSCVKSRANRVRSHGSEINQS